MIITRADPLYRCVNVRLVRIAVEEVRADFPRGEKRSRAARDPARWIASQKRETEGKRGVTRACEKRNSFFFLFFFNEVPL